MPSAAAPSKHREREIGIARGIGAAHLDVARPACRRHAHERVDAALRPDGVDRRVPRGDETLVRVDRGIADRGRRGRVLEQAADDVEHRLFVGSVTEQQLDVQAAAGALLERFRHEGRVETEARGDVLGDRAQREHVVGRGERIVVREVDLVLAGAVLVMRRRDAQCPWFAARRRWRCALPRRDRWPRNRSTIPTSEVLVPPFEEIELDLEADRQAPAATARALSIARRSVVRGQPSNGAPSGIAMSQIKRASRAVGSRPRVDRERRRIGAQHHVELFAAHEPVDRSAVEGDAAVERGFELARPESKRSC